MAFDEQLFAPSEGDRNNTNQDSRSDQNLFEAAYTFAKEHPEVVAAGTVVVAAGAFLAAKRFGLAGLADDAAKVWDPSRGPTTEALIAKGIPIRPASNILQRVDDSVWATPIRPATEPMIARGLPIQTPRMDSLVAALRSNDPVERFKAAHQIGKLGNHGPRTLGDVGTESIKRKV